jgi:hypothetical protein
MKQFKSQLLLAVVLTLVVLMLASCSRLCIGSRSSKKVGHGPPPHAPAHGHRRKHVSGPELVYDSGRGVYIVVGFPNHYYFSGRYYRLHADHWQASVDINAGWKPVGEEVLPPGLRKKGKAKHVSKVHPGRGHGRQKHKD